GGGGGNGWRGEPVRGGGRWGLGVFRARERDEQQRERRDAQCIEQHGDSLVGLGGPKMRSHTGATGARFARGASQSRGLLSRSCRGAARTSQGCAAHRALLVVHHIGCDVETWASAAGLRSG